MIDVAAVVPHKIANMAPHQQKSLWKPPRKVNEPISIVQGAQTCGFLVEGVKSNNGNDWGTSYPLFSKKIKGHDSLMLHKSWGHCSRGNMSEKRV